MNKLSLIALCEFIFLFLIAATAAENEDPVSAANNYPAGCNMPSQSVQLAGKSCNNYAFNPLQISCLLPVDVQGELRQNNFNNRQRASDLFSWQTFVALNWPASTESRGQPDAALPITADRQRVWESWKETDEIFLAGGKQPASWTGQQQTPALPEGCSGSSDKKILYRTQKVSEVLNINNSLQPTKADKTLPGTLTGQNGAVVRYEIRYNKTAFDYIFDNRLYSSNHQNIVNEVRFPAGSILIKAAWLPLKDETREKHFYTVEACVCDPRTTNTEPLQNCRDETAGLVGFHVMEKTNSAPQWMWSTFEQVDNVKNTSGIAASFNKENCLENGKPCAVNKQTEPGVPNQVVRSIKIPDTQTCDNNQATDNVVLLNQNMQAALAERNSAFQYYQLINTQWPILPPPGTNQPETVFTPLPALFGNTTLETFVQPTSSCMGCHAMARSTRLDRFVSADFTFTLDNASPAQKNPHVLPAPTAKTASESVLKGFALMNNTYKTLPDKVKAKLNCSSCHLDEGRNPSASWLVEMDKAYAIVKNPEGSGLLSYPESLYARINGCFTRSMNGVPLCDITQTDDACSTNEAMQSLREYTEWLTAQRATLFDSDSPRGFPQLPKLTGNAADGKATYIQKCAFCHGANGEGRYEHDVYYRPALWGKDSYNACAGMAREPGAKGTHLAGFIKSNMPLHSGGVLTAQESWDLATYINSQCRPGKAGCPENLYPSSAFCKESNDLESLNTLPVQP